MADVRLPGTLTPLFPGLPRRLDVEAPTVLAAIDSLVHIEAGEPGVCPNGDKVQASPQYTIDVLADGAPRRRPS